ncbi:beta-galactosidase trimerization domain-containing protein [Candidatus Latescibacterota bacterium]
MREHDNHYPNRRDFIKSASAAGAVFAAGIRPLVATASGTKENPDNWFKNIYRLLHLDAHHGGFKKIYGNFDAEATAQTFKELGVQMVSYMAQDGPSYYPTKIGKKHPGLDRDFVGEFTRALKKRGIRTIVYFGMGGCDNSPYLDEVVIPQMKEIVELYDVDGFFPDGILQPHLMNTCRCDHCIKLFAQDIGGDIPESDDDPKAFAYRKWSNMRMEAHMKKVYRVLSSLKPDIAFLNNHLWISRYPVTPPAYVKHICWDTPIPNVGLYALNFSLEARYLATLTDVLPDITWSCMNVSSHDWVDYELRETEAFLQECATMLAACGRTYPSYNPYPSGNPAPALMEACDTLNKRTIELEPYVKNCTPVKDVAILHSADSAWSRAPMIPHATWTPSHAYQPVAGAHKAMIEGHVQIGITNSDVFLKTIDDYRAVILPSQRILSDRECEAIKRFVSIGGALIATGETGLRDSDNNRLKDFSLAEVLGVRYKETIGTSFSYLRVPSNIEKYGIPAYDTAVAGPYTRIQTTTAQTLIELVPPYEGIMNGTPPPAEVPEGPGVTLNNYGKGKAIYCASELFCGYYIKDTPVLRKLAHWMLGLVYPEEARTIVAENTPVNVEMFYNHRRNERFIHLVNCSGDKREVGVAQTQDFVTVHGIGIHVKLPEKPKSVTLVPDGRIVHFDYSGGWLTFGALPLTIHHVYSIS